MTSQQERERRPRSLTAMLAQAFLVLSVTVLVITLAVETYLSFRTQQEVVAGRQQLIAQDAASTVSSFIQEKFSELEAISELGELIPASQEDQEGALGNILGLDPAFRQLIVLDRDGQELAQVSRLSEAASGNLVERAGENWFDRVSAGSRHIGSVYVDDVTSEPLMVLAVPIADVFGDLQGVLMAEVNLKFMWDLVDRLEVGRSGTAYVVNGDGDLIAYGDIARVLRGENVSDLQEVREFVNGSAVTDVTGVGISQGIEGMTVVGTYVPLGTPNWAVVTEVPVREAYQPVIQEATLSGAVLIGMAILAGGAGIYAARRLSAPILDLTQTATRIADGEIDLQAEPEGPAEVVDLARAFNSMTAQLRELIGSLEERVARRTRSLRAAAEVGRATNVVLDPDELLRQTVNLVRERFGLYYVGLFLMDEERDVAVLEAGTGEAGERMIKEGHELKVGGDSMIGQCVADGKPHIALDVGQEAVRFENPLLPQTRSEMALPLRSRGRVIGAMTVQSVEETAFDEGDIVVMRTMADQVAVAIDNARLFAQNQAALDAERRAYGQLSREAWRELLRTRPGWGYRYDRQVTVPVDGDWPEEMRRAEETGRTIRSYKEDDGEGGTTLAVPITVRDRVVGVLRFRKDEGGEPWVDEEINLLETLVAQLGVALESARLYRDTQQRAVREQLVADITTRVRTSVDIQRILQTAVRELGGALGTDRAFIQLDVGGRGGSLEQATEELRAQARPDLPADEDDQGSNGGSNGGSGAPEA